MQVVFLTSEMAPWCKTGGLGDFSGALPDALAAAGCEIHAFVPLYRAVGPEARRFLRTACTVEVPIGGQVHTARILKMERGYWRSRTWFVDCPYYYDREGIYDPPGGRNPDNDERYILLVRAVLQSLETLRLAPDILHLNDWQTAIGAAYHRVSPLGMTPALARARTVLSIHNLGYPGVFGWESLLRAHLPLELNHPERGEFHGGVSLLKLGIVHAGAVVAVSPTYAREIQTPAHGMGLDGLLRSVSHKLTGILNGIDDVEWNPAADEHLPAPFHADDLRGKAACREALLRRFGLSPGARGPLFGMVSRLVPQKGIDLVLGALDEIIRVDGQLAVLGSGARAYAQAFEAAARAWPGRIGVHIGFSEELSHLVEAGADVFLMPSLYEPCGLNQFYSMRYGTFPIVRNTGGLADSVRQFNESSGEGTGVLFDHYDSAAIRWAIHRAAHIHGNPELRARIIRNGMALDSSWAPRAREYLNLYQRLIG
ncbi:MAG: Glycogen synthase [Myxococcota bacterium]|nr:Glycogen synthase [Myxococcota bacterium]